MASDEQSKPTQGEAAKSGTSNAKNETTQGKQAAEQSAASSGQTTGQTSATDAVTLLKNDHRAVEKLFAEYEKASNRSRKGAIIEQVATMLKIHSELEETIFYPAVRQQAEADDKLDEAQVEHDTLKILIADLESGSNSEFRDAKVKVLSEYVKHHVQEEEAGTGILEQGRKSGLDLEELGEQMAQLKEELQADPGQLRAEPVSIQSIGQSRQRGRPPMMAGRGNDRGMQQRDEQGRFTERGGYGDEQRSSRGRGYDDDYRAAAPRSGGGYGERGGEGRGGWFGDPRGHSEAARRGWDEREQSGSSRYSGRYDDDDRRGGGSRRGSQGQGWHGDPQGHSEAARRGWQHRDDDDDRRYGRNMGGSDESRGGGRGQSRGGGRGEGQGGWFGDPRGHSEAARRGWDERR